MFVKEGKGITKMCLRAWLCMSYTLSGCEVSAEHFLLCLRRFMGRRGRPEMIISDNAAQFKLVKNVVDKQWKELTLDKELLSYLSNIGIRW